MKTAILKRCLCAALAVVLCVATVGVHGGGTLIHAKAADAYAGTGTFTQCTGVLTSGYYVFGGGSTTNVSAINNTVGSSWIKYTDTTATNGTITNPVTSIVWYYDATAGTFKNGSNYIYWSSGNMGGVGTKNTPVTVTETATSGVYNITVTATPDRVLRLNGTSGYRFYTSSTGKAEIYFFKLEEAGESTCEHTNKVAIGEAKEPTCTEPGITAGEKCADCDAVITPQQTIPAKGHNYVDGVCSVCNAVQPTMLTINRAAFGDASEYAWHAWTATTTKGDSISGSGYIYGSTKDSIQMNAKTNTNGNYIYNTTALPGGITSIKVTAAKTTYRGFVVLTSDSPFDSTTNRLTAPEGTTSVTVNEDGATWEFTTNHKYFAIVLVDAGGAAYLSSIEITYAVCNHTNTEAIGEAEAATCTEDGITAGKKCADCGEILEAQEVLEATGHKDENGDHKCDVCQENLCTEHKWIDGEVIEEATCTKTGLIAQVCENCGEPGEDRVTEKAPHTPVTDPARVPSCTKTGLTEGSHCSVCEEVLVKQTELPMIDHNYVNGTCIECGDTVVTGTQLAEFQFGENGNVSHKDGEAISAGTKYTADGFTLTFTTATGVYGGAFDAKGNSALKLGTKSGAASFDFTVENNVHTVVLYIAGYKDNKANIQVNGTAYTIESHSEDGAYTKIVVNTAENKTVTLETLSGGYRAMIDSIEFWGTEVGKATGYTVTLGDNIGVNFYMWLSEETLADETAYMQFTLPNGNTEKVLVKDVLDSARVTKDATYYKFTANIAVKEMSQEIKAQLFTAAGNSKEYTYTVKQYAMYVINNPDNYTENEIALVKAMLNYGAYAQLMFGYETENLANSEIGSALDDVTVDESYKKVYTPSIEGAKYLGTTTEWDANTAIRHYFNITGKNITFWLCDATGEPVQKLDCQTSSRGTYVAIDGILAKDMKTAYTLKISDGTNVQTITYSVYSYFYDILKGEYEDDQKNAIKAAYLYAEAAVTYLENR